MLNKILIFLKILNIINLLLNILNDILLALI